MPIYRSSTAALGLALVLLAAPVQAQDDVTQRTPGVRDVAMTPLNDLNLAQDEIPPILLWARDNTYDNTGMEDCEAIRRGIGDLDAVLGDDVDTTAPEQDRLSVGRIARSAVGSLMPFRGIVRELTGANSHEREFRQAIAGGLMRRSYLKGLGEARGCAYPARPMPPALQANIEAGEMTPDEVVGDDGTRFRSSPVVQPIK